MGILFFSFWYILCNIHTRPKSYTVFLDLAEVKQADLNFKTNILRMLCKTYLVQWKQKKTKLLKGLKKCTSEIQNLSLFI